jgi:sugar phosphate isomerase/epimerase
MAVQLALTPDTRWPASMKDLVRATSTTGFSALGIAASRVDAAVIRDYRAAGLRCHEILALQVGEDKRETLAAARELAGAAGAIDADWVLAVFRSPLTIVTASIIRECAATFAEVGAGMAVEFSPLGPIASIREGMEVVDVAGRSGRAGLMIDSWHFSFSDSTWDDLQSVPLDSVAYVQFADALPPVSPKLGRETMDRRALPGEGVLDLRRFASTLLDRGWEGLVSVEILNADLRTAPILTVIPRFYEATAPFWQ